MSYYEIRDTYEVKIGRNRDARGPDMRHGHGPELIGTGTLIGDHVCNKKGETLAKIKEIMLDTRSGKVRYAVLSFGGFLGMGDKLFAVPWDVLTLDTEKKRCVLNVEKDRLKGAPGFEKDSWPNMSDPSWEKKIHAYYGPDSIPEN